VAGGTRRWSFCSGTVDRTVGTLAAREGGVVLCGVARTLAGGGRVEFSKLAVGIEGGRCVGLRMGSRLRRPK
jgi:hypothetical protein